MNANVTDNHHVKDISLAAWGRKEIEIAETEMPGLMAVRAEFGPSPAAQGRPRRRVPAHDDPDGGAHRDPAGAGRRSPLGFVQHLLDPGSRRRRHRRARDAGLRLQGRKPAGILGLLRPHLRMAQWRNGQHDPRRRRRRDLARLSRRPGRSRSVRAQQARQ